MKFNTQVCTTREQSERLLALGLKKETADMYLTRCFVGNNGTPMIFVGAEHKPSTVLFSKEDIPAWSFDRMIAMFPKNAHNEYGNLSFKWEYSNNKYHFYVLAKYAPMGLLLKKHSNDLYELAVSALEWLVKGAFIDEQYLNESL